MRLNEHCQVISVCRPQIKIPETEQYYQEMSSVILSQLLLLLLIELSRACQYILFLYNYDYLPLSTFYQTGDEMTFVFTVINYYTFLTRFLRMVLSVLSICFDMQYLSFVKAVTPLSSPFHNSHQTQTYRQPQSLITQRREGVKENKKTLISPSFVILVFQFQFMGS